MDPPRVALGRLYRRAVPAPLRVRLWAQRRRAWDGIFARDDVWRWVPEPALQALLARRLRLDAARGWLFLLGVNNSGTTLLMRLLGRHPLIRTLPGEGHHLTDHLVVPARAGQRRQWGLHADRYHWTEATPGPDPRRVQWDWAPHYPGGPGYLAEKSPPDTLRSRWLQAHFRPARFISIIRNGYAVAEGAQRRADVDLASGARHWAIANAILLDDALHLHQHLLLRYEDLVADPVRTLASVASFLEIPPFARDAATGLLHVHNLTGRASVLRDFNADSVARLSRADRAIITTEAGPMLARLGYPLVG